MLRALPSLTVFAAVLTAGVVPGLWTGRWTESTSLEEAAARLAQVPPTVGEWDGRDLPVNPREQAAAQASGYLSRRYVHRRTGAVVSLALLCGRPGPISVHTPDICYAGSGYEEVGAPTRCAIPDSPGDHLWARQFRKAAAVPVQHLRVLYGWSAAGAWEAPDNPRLTFARRPALYKLYAIRELAGPGEALDDDPALDLLRALAPPLRAALAAP